VGSEVPVGGKNRSPKEGNARKNAIKEILQANPFFSSMSPEHLDLMLSGATTAYYESDEVLFHEGEPADRLFVIEIGRVAVEAHEPGNESLIIESLGPGDLLGWSWLFEPFVWHFQARAIGPAKVVILQGAHLLILAERDPRFGYELMKRITQVVIHRLHATRKRLLDQHIKGVLEG
jgi:CRP-like cAMP-binding protein